MQSFTGGQITAVAGAIILSGILYFLPHDFGPGLKQAQQRGPATAKENNGEEVRTVYDLNARFSEVRLRLTPQALDRLKVIEGISTENGQNDSLAVFWDENNTVDVAAYYFEQIAKKGSSEKQWLNAAYRYFDSFKSARDGLARAFLVGKATECYRKVVEINPKNLNARTDLGVCLSESLTNPMEGIQMLRQVVLEDPKHEVAQTNLALLDIKSGQFDKAIARLDTVLKINPKNIIVLTYLGDVYLRTGNKAKALDYYGQFRDQTTDTLMKTQMIRYIDEVKRRKDPIQ